MKEIEAISRVILRLWENKKRNLIEKIIENLRNEGKIYALKEVLNFIKEYRVKLEDKEPAKLFLAFDYDEGKIEKLLEKNFGLKIKIVEKVINDELILGGKILTSNYLFDFSLRNLLEKLFKK
ncbi:MAG: F0F1 ATP synthase subunit delta [Candidatus Aenigmatarchaeota archaeon]|jgi:F0F1-type ATP synthase delta subunit